jgi:hypothetical protein
MAPQRVPYRSDPKRVQIMAHKYASKMRMRITAKTIRIDKVVEICRLLEASS